MNADAVIGCDAVDAGADWLRLKTAGGAVRTIPWSGVKLAGMGIQGEVTINGVTEKTAPFVATHDSLWIVYPDSGFAQVMIEKTNPKRSAILDAFAQRLETRWRGDQLTAGELAGAMWSRSKVQLPKAIVVMMIVAGPHIFTFARGAIFRAAQIGGYWRSSR